MFTRLDSSPSEKEIINTWKYADKVYVSIVCITFNQEVYIEEAINSFLAQETEYRFEVIIHDDASTDKTQEILERYVNEYPSIIKLIVQEENQYSKNCQKPFVNALDRAEGLYIAVCEGDDFWIDKSKIDKQIKHLISNDNASMVHTNVYDFEQVSNKVILSQVPLKTNTTKSLFVQNRIRTLTTMFRKIDCDSFFSEHGSESEKWLLGDWPLWIYLSMKGEVIFIDDVTAVYRVLPESASNTKSEAKYNLFRLSTLKMRVYMAYKSNMTSEALGLIGNSSIANHLLHGTELIDNAFKFASLKYKFLLLINVLIPVKKIAEFRLRLK
ncbi:putative glycosyltransferase EpsE [Vibrio chagasii]|uniref:glycosyltransferase n=1 Tax=unclassified Vibrio TaxID=2614977 RepID=UPI001493657B|nr:MULTISPECIES: glycosyltransferase [unclassified Vibrio]CAH6800242.1 putative glycosyltransferase EpsE [Vibrio chagasii]NOI37742.1 glycosyltransferase [Vibrio sp. 070316B]NOI85993.1 glycosyltransferase [Vibrio sp. 99K-1]CAH6859493.1 putative glycosyltransferase EpsE [Vibrio chagasii]CAH6868393.1 putative glycosyltransferase EpsE [Vibrio chagasii]